MTLSDQKIVQVKISGFFFLSAMRAAYLNQTECSDFNIKLKLEI